MTEVLQVQKPLRYLKNARNIFICSNIATLTKNALASKRLKISSLFVRKYLQIFS